MFLREEAEGVEVVEGLEAGVDVGEEILGVAAGHVTELLNAEVRQDLLASGQLVQAFWNLHLQAGGVDLAVQVHLIESWFWGRGK